MTGNRKFWESFMVLMIFVAVIQIFMEDISRLGGWSVSTRTSLIIIGFLLDFIFTIEFAIRSILSRKGKGWVNYFKHEKGWVDLVSSVPLLLLNSGPIMLGMFFPGSAIALPFLGVLNILKVTKILRVARMLRMLRVLKMFKKLSDAEAEKRRAQLGRIISIAIVTITVVLIISPLFPKLFYNMDTNVNLKKQKYVTALQDWYTSIRRRDKVKIDYIKSILQDDKDVLFLYFVGQPVVNNLGEGAIPEKVIPMKYFYTDYKVFNYPTFKTFKLWYSIQDVVADNARINLLIETIIVVLIFSFMFFYKDVPPEKHS